MALSGTAKRVVPRETLARRMHWAATGLRWRIKLLATAEITGAVGLIVPLATGIAPGLASVAALCLAVLMVGAARTHQGLGENLGPPVVIGRLCVLTAIGRLPGLGTRGGR